MCADCIHGRSQEVQIAHTRYLNRILEREENAFSCPDLRRHLKKIAAFKAQFIRDDLISIAARQYLGERALAGAVRSHDRVDFPSTNIKIQTTKDLLSID